MGETVRWGIPYPEGTDLVRDGDNAMQAIAETVDASMAQIRAGVYTSPAGTGTRVGTVAFSPEWTAVPVVLLTPKTSPSPSAPTSYAVLSVTTTGFTINIYRADAAAIQMQWLAVVPVSPGTGTFAAPDVSARSLGAPTPPGADEYVRRVIATCTADGCPASGVGIVVEGGWRDEDGTVHDVDNYTCGACSNAITDVGPVIDEPAEGEE